MLADSQSAGRGRGTNTWWSAAGNLAVTFVMQQNPHLEFGQVPLLAGLAVRRALVRLTAREEIGLKWPNDLVVGHRKAAGLLCERLQRVDLIGVGINVNAGSREAPASLRERITSLRELSGTVRAIRQKVQKQDEIGTDPAARKDARIIEVPILLDDPAPAAGLTNLQVDVVIHP